MPSPKAARFQVLVAALLFSTGGVAIKSCRLDPWQIASFRSATAALVMLALVPAARRALGPRMWLVGCAFGGTMVLYALANRATTAANAIFLQDTAPLYVLLLAPWLLGEGIRGRDLAVMAALGAGLALILLGGEPATATAPAPLRGNLMGAGAGLCWALTVIGLRWLARASDGTRVGGVEAAAGAVVAGNVIACLFTLPRALAPASAAAFADAGPGDWLIVLYLGAVQIALAYLFLNAGVARLRAFETSLLLLVEPVFATVWAALLLAERPGPLALAGAAAIVLATAANSLPARARAPARR